MYHHFTRRTSTRQQIMNRKLQQVLNYYTHLQEQKPKDSQYKQYISQPLNFQLSVCIFQSLYNEKHNCMVFWLSNDKLIRYDFEQEVFEEVQGLADDHVMKIQLLEIGACERYLILGDQGITICTMLKERSPTKLQAQKPQIYMQDIQQNNQNNQKMQEQSQIYEQQLQSFTINTINCQTFKQNIRQNISEAGTQQLKEGQKPKNYRIRSASSFIVRDSSALLRNFNSQNLINQDQQNEQKNEQKNEKIFLVTVFSMAAKPNLQLVLYELNLTQASQNKINLQDLPTKFRTIQYGPYKQVLTITQVQFPNNKHFTELAMSYIQIPFSHQTQSQTINPIEVTNSNAKFTRPSLIHECDQHFVTQKCGVNCFSFYFIAQTITHVMEPAEYRHFAFEFRFAVCAKECKIIANETWGSPMYEYPEREVTCPARVYCLPLVHNTSILSFINITKSFSHFTNQDYQWQPNCYKFTTVTMVEGAKMQFSHIECKITTHEEQSNAHKYRHVLEHEHMKLHAVVDENLIFAQALLIDLANQYAIIMAYDEKVLVQNYNHQQTKGSAKKVLESIIIVVNLRLDLAPNSKRVAAKYTLTDCEDSLRPYLLLSLDSKAGPMFSSDNLQIESEPIVANDSLHLPKMLTVMHCRMKRENKKLKGYDSVFEQISVLPKAIIYGNMLARISAKKQQETEEKKPMQMEEEEGKMQTYKMDEMDSFFAQIMHFLSP